MKNKNKGENYGPNNLFKKPETFHAKNPIKSNAN